MKNGLRLLISCPTSSSCPVITRPEIEPAKVDGNVSRPRMREDVKPGRIGPPHSLSWLFYQNGTRSQRPRREQVALAYSWVAATDLMRLIAASRAVLLSRNRDLGHLCQLQCFIEFAIGDQARIARDGSAVKLQLDPAVKTDAQRLLACLTHWILQISAARGSFSPVFMGEIVTSLCAAASVIGEIQGLTSW